MARQVHPDLEPAAYGLLVRLEDGGPQRATDLAGYFGVGKATISRQLQALVTLGLVDRVPDPGDRRASLIRLTEEGRARFTRVRDARRLSYARKLAAWDRTEIAELARLLHRLNSLGETEE
ncbi:MarR family transcriptional regulator [Streptomyces sp. NHF165]|nr:MarR family transcriptional regulator [Streptomyces cacaoi]QHF98873.1 MarR family transcriptional regulator [Streptomyces sp. NHF165]